MAVLRIDIERALDEITSQEEGMRFQGLAVVLGKMRWPELIARQRKKDFGLDAYATASLTSEKVGKGLAASITPTLKKISSDVKTGRENFPDLKMLLFVTPAKVGNADRRKWETAILEEHNVELHILEREEIITLMVMPEYAAPRATFLNIDIDHEPQTTELLVRIKLAAATITRTWAGKTKGQPLIDLTAVQLASDGAETTEVFSLEQIDQALLHSRRLVLEGPAGRGKTTTLIQLAQRERTIGIPFIIDIPAWLASRRGFLEYVAGMPAFQAEGITSVDLARAQQTEPFLLLLNGWNEITESNSSQASDVLRELERDFPSAGVIVATRTHHLTPPLPGALRLRLFRLRTAQRSAYLDARLGARGAELRARIDVDPPLDDLTRTPFILSEVASLFEAGIEIPSTKMGILAKVFHLQEQREEHRNALQASPIFGRQTDYLTALANEMTRRGAVMLLEADARVVVSSTARDLVRQGQIDPVGAPAVLSTLTAHHVLERIDYPQTAFQFEHQQLQEFCAALNVRELLLDIRLSGDDAAGRFTTDYVNEPAWAEVLRMIAETFAEEAGDRETVRIKTHAGVKLVEMALAVDLVFAGELAQLCGGAVWDVIREGVNERFRAVYAFGDGSFRQYVLAAMIATGANDFSDIIVPLLSSDDENVRHRTYRLWPDIRISSIGPNWREQVSGWSEYAREDFVAEVLHQRIDDDIIAFAAEDNSMRVKSAAVFSLMWTGAEDEMICILESMDAETFESFALKNTNQIPLMLRPKGIAVVRSFIESTTDQPARLRAALDLIELGESGLDVVIKDALAALPSREMNNLGSRYIHPALEYFRSIDPIWVSEWVANQIADGSLYDHEYWLQFATVIPDALIEKHLHHIETEQLKNTNFNGIITIIAANADAKLAARVFVKLRELQCQIDMESNQRHEFEWQLIRQLEALFRSLPDEISVDGILSSVTTDDLCDINVATNLLSKVARSDVEPLHIANEDLKARLYTYLKSSLALVLRQDDFNGKHKANLASSIAQIGKPNDMEDLVFLIRADIERVRRGRVARLAGDHGPLGNGCTMTYASWHVAAVMHLDPIGADQVLINLLPEPEYLSDVAAAMARSFLPKLDRLSDRILRYDLIWAAREGCTPLLGDMQRRKIFTEAINAEIQRLLKQKQDGKPVAGLQELAKAIAIIDARGSVDVALAAITTPGQWNQYIRLDIAERLLMAGVILPVTAAFALIDSILERTENWMQDSDRHLLCRILSLCPFVDNPAIGIAKIREVLRMRPLRSYELHELISALAESRSDSALDLLSEFASDAPTFEQCENTLVSAFAKLDTPRARDVLVSFVDPKSRTIASTHSFHHADMLVARLAEMAQRRPEAAMKLQELCERGIPEPNRQILSKIMAILGTPDAIAANLKLIDDEKAWPVPHGLWSSIEDAFVEERPYGKNDYTYTKHARSANELRIQLFMMVIYDHMRRQGALMLLGHIEEWRLEYGRPQGEPRHPDLPSGHSWPPLVTAE